MLEHSGRGVEVGGGLGPVLMVSLELAGPFAGVFAGEELGQGYPDVGFSGALLGHVRAS